MQNIGLNTEQPFKSGHSLWFQNSKPPLSWGFQDNLPKKAGCPLRKQPVNSPKFRLLTGPRTEKAAGLVHLDARWYNPYTSRFVQPDLWNFSSTGLPKDVQHEVMQFAALNTSQLLSDPGQQMRYGYVRGNPVSLIDPYGLEIADGAYLVTAGIHSAIYINNPGIEEDFLYDGYGGYSVPTGDGGSYRNSDDSFMGHEADIDAYAAYHSSSAGGGDTLQMTPIETTPLQNEQIQQTALEYGAASILGCASSAGDILASACRLDTRDVILPSTLQERIVNNNVCRSPEEK